MNCDLYMHSLFSDGTYTPAEIIAEAKEVGLGTITSTDHNTVAGLPDFIQEAEQQGVIAIGGVELSTAHEDNEYHLLGLFIASVHYHRWSALRRNSMYLKEIATLKPYDSDGILS